MSQVRALRKLMAVQAKLYLREPVALFFTLLLAPLYMIVTGFIFGNMPAAEAPGTGQLDMYVPAYAAMVVAVVGLTSAPITIAGQREAGVLRRFRATPLHPLMFIMADVVVYLAMTLLGVLLLVLLGTTAYRVRLEGSLLAFTAGSLLSAAAFLALGYAIAGLARSLRVATVLGSILLCVMMLFSGTTVPLDVMPEAARRAAHFVPLTHVVTLLRGLWFGEPLAEHYMELAVLGGILVVGTIIATLAFRWE